MLKLKFQQVGDVEAPLPQRGTPSSAGIDFFIPFGTWKGSDRSFILKPQQKLIIPLGLAVNIPKGYCLFLCDKSGRAVRDNLVVLASLIDEDYQGEIHAVVFNLSKSQEVTLYEGEKILQGKLEEVPTFEIVEVPKTELLYYDKVSLRGIGKFGSTGLTRQAK